MEENNAQKTLKNASYNFLGYVWPMGLAIFVTPFIVHKLGVRDYGIYIFINTLISLMGLLDFGFSTSVIKHLAEYHAKQKKEKLSHLINSMNSLFLLMGLIGLGLFLSASYWIDFVFPQQVPQAKELSALFIIAGFLFLVNCLSSVFFSIPNSLQRFDISSKIGLISLTFSSLASVLLVQLGYKLIALFTLQLGMAIILLLVSIKISHRLLPQISFGFAWNKEELKSSYQFASKVFLSNIANSLLTYLDRLIIPIFLGPTQLTYYSLPGNISSKIPGVSNALAGVIFPVAVRFNSLDDKEKLQALYRRSFRLLLVLSCAICFSIIFLAEPIMREWLGEEFAKNSSKILIVLALTNLFLAMSGPLASFLLAINRIRLLIITNVVVAVINASLLFILLPRFGIMGAAWAYLFSVTPIIYMFYYTEKHLLQLPKTGWYYPKLLSKISLVTLIAGLIDKIIIENLITNLFGLVILGPSAVLIYLAIYKLFNFYEKEDLADINNLRLSFINRIKKYARKV